MIERAPISEAELLVEMKRAWSEYFLFYSNSGKDQRELWVVDEFLKALPVQFAPDELHAQPQHSKVDVEFRDARFQVKEIPDPNIRRGAEIKDTYERVMKAKTLQETIGPGFVYDTPPVVDGYELVRDAASGWAGNEKYREHKASLDLLFYVTRPMASGVGLNEARVSELSLLGWRSVSCLTGRRALVLYASPSAPLFLQVAK